VFQITLQLAHNIHCAASNRKYIGAHDPSTWIHVINDRKISLRVQSNNPGQRFAIGPMNSWRGAPPRPHCDVDSLVSRNISLDIYNSRFLIRTLHRTIAPCCATRTELALSEELRSTYPSGYRADCRTGDGRSRTRFRSVYTARLQSLVLITEQDVGHLPLHVNCLKLNQTRMLGGCLQPTG
jgi:hypothetical protein